MERTPLRTTFMNRHVKTLETERTGEWFVPRFGPRSFRSFVGLLFLPYTGMVVSFAAVGATLAGKVHWDRLLAIAVIYSLGLGIGAHALDGLGGRGRRPWGAVFSRYQLWGLAIGSLVAAYAIAVYYMVRYVPALWPIALAEGFFAFAYNLEWQNGRFHTDGWFAFSWGFLPVLAGYVMQTGGLSLAALITAGGAGFFSLVEIRASRPYKDLVRGGENLTPDEKRTAARFEAILKAVSLGVILMGAGSVIRRAME